MTIQRTTKVFINDYDTTIMKSQYYAETLSGYIAVTIQDPDDPTTALKQQFYISNAQVNLDVLSYWRAGFVGRYESYKSYYKAEFQDVKVKRGNVIKKINNGKGEKVIACWMAAYDSKVLAFEIHYPNGSIYRTKTDGIFVINNNQQREFDWLPATKIEECDPYIEMSQPHTVKTSRRKGTKLSLADEAHILHDLKSKISQSKIATRFGVSAPYITKLKKQFIKEGKL